MSGLIQTIVGGAVILSAPEYIAPSAPVLRHISRGAFFDRFGAQKYPILASTDAIVKALITDTSVRAYIDLDRADLPTGLAMIVSAGYAIDTTAILSAPVLDSERP